MNRPAISPIENYGARSATDQVFQALYDAIVALQLPPGSKVAEADIARQLDVSRQPVRDAFFRLSELGFLSIRPQRATLITPISEKAVQDAVFVRSALEVACLHEVIAKLTPEAEERLRANLAEQKLALDDPDPTTFHALDEALHETLCDLADHGHVWALIQEQKAHMDRIRFLTLSEERRRQVYAEHKALLDAIFERDAGKAEERLRLHLNDIINVVASVRDAHPDYFEAPI